MPSIDVKAAVEKAKAKAKASDKPAPPADKPAAPAPEAVSAPGVDSPPPAASALKRYKVGLKWNPDHVVEGYDRLDAINAYKKLCGILATPHEFTVEEL